MYKGRQHFFTMLTLWVSKDAAFYVDFTSLCDKMHPKMLILKNAKLDFYCLSHNVSCFYRNNFLGAFCHQGKIPRTGVRVSLFPAMGKGTFRSK
jgi:hypothetical protein